jgi:hypothetical protein
MSALGLLAGQLLPWILGSVWVALLWRRDLPGRWPLVAGYGYLAGSFALTLWMRLASLAGLSFGWASIGLPLAAIAVAGFVFILRTASPGWWRLFARPGAVELDGEARIAYRVLWWLLLALLLAHFAFSALEIVWRPLFPWDAWSQWATKARVWYELGRIVPFDGADAWFAGNTYIDSASRYPGMVPLLQVWSAIALGRWDDSLMNWPWLSFAVALALVFYGQLREAGRGPLFSMAGAYLACSLPFVDTHTALAGYADLPLAVYFGASAIALWRWCVNRDARQLALAIVLAAACPLVKNPGWVWLATLVPALIVTLLPKFGLRVVLGLWAAAAIGLLVLAKQGGAMGAYKLKTSLQPVLEPLWQNYFELANWHLLWYLLPVVLLLNRRRIIATPLVQGTVMVASGLAFLLVVFTLTSAEMWVRDFSTVNRATLHLVPLLTYYVLELAHSAIDTLRPAPASTAAPAAAD